MIVTPPTVPESYQANADTGDALTFAKALLTKRNCAREKKNCFTFVKCGLMRVDGGKCYYCLWLEWRMADCWLLVKTRKQSYTLFNSNEWCVIGVFAKRENSRWNSPAVCLWVIAGQMWVKHSSACKNHRIVKWCNGKLISQFRIENLQMTSDNTGLETRLPNIDA